MKLGTRLILLDDVLKSWAGYSYTETLELKLPSCLQRLSEIMTVCVLDFGLIVRYTKFLSSLIQGHSFIYQILQFPISKDQLLIK